MERDVSRRNPAVISQQKVSSISCYSSHQNTSCSITDTIPQFFHRNLHECACTAFIKRAGDGTLGKPVNGQVKMGFWEGMEWVGMDGVWQIILLPPEQQQVHIVGLGVLTSRGTWLNGFSVLSKGALLTITVCSFLFQCLYLEVTEQKWEVSNMLWGDWAGKKLHSNGLGWKEP